MKNISKKQKILLIVAIALVAVALIGLIVGLSIRNSETVKLYVNGKRVRTEHVSITENGGARLPLVKVVEALGYDVEWKDESTCTWVANGKTYTLSLTERTLREGEGIDLLAPARNGTNPIYACQAVEGDIVLDNISLWSILLRMDHDLLVYVHFNENRVTVEKKNDP